MNERTRHCTLKIRWTDNSETKKTANGSETNEIISLATIIDALNLKGRLLIQITAERRNNTLKIPTANHKPNRDNNMNIFQHANSELLAL